MQPLTELTAPVREVLPNPQESERMQCKHERSILQEHKNSLRPQLWKQRHAEMCSIQTVSAASWVSLQSHSRLFRGLFPGSGCVSVTKISVDVRKPCQCYVSYIFNDVPLLYSIIKHRYSRGWCRCAACTSQSDVNFFSVLSLAFVGFVVPVLCQLCGSAC